MSEEGSFLGGEQRPGYWQTIRPIVGSSLRTLPVYNGYSTAQYLVIKATITGVLVANAIFAQLTTFGKAVNLSAPSPPVPSVTLPFESFNKFALQYYISKMCVDAKTVNSDLCMRSDGTCPDNFYRLVVNTTKTDEDFLQCKVSTLTKINGQYVESPFEPDPTCMNQCKLDLLNSFVKGVISTGSNKFGNSLNEADAIALGVIGNGITRINQLSSKQLSRYVSFLDSDPGDDSYDNDSSCPIARANTCSLAGSLSEISRDILMGLQRILYQTPSEPPDNKWSPEYGWASLANNYSKLLSGDVQSGPNTPTPVNATFNNTVSIANSGDTNWWAIPQTKSEPAKSSEKLRSYLNGLKGHYLLV